MPHVIVKMYAGLPHADKARMAQAITDAVTSTLGYGEESISVAIQDVSPREWAEQVYRPDILETSAELLKKPGYDPFR
jgi:4-oxalocrotonate tautomerase